MSAHSHGPAPAASRHTRRIVLAVLIPAALLTLIAMIVMWPAQVHSSAPAGDGQRALGTVIALSVPAPAPSSGSGSGSASGSASARPGSAPSGSGSASARPGAGAVVPGAGAAVPGSAAGLPGSATVRITSGPGAGTEQTVDLPQGPGSISLRAGDKVVLDYLPDALPGGHPYTVTDHQRSTPLTWLIALAVAVIVAFGRWRGLTSLAGLAVSFAILLFFVIPAILDGSPPLLVAVVGAAAIMFAALYLTHGFSVHISVAVAGTLASLVLTGLLGAAFTALLNLTGVSSDDTSSLLAFQGDIDLRGLLLAGIVIGALGVLDDVTVTQAVTVAEIAAAGSTSRWELYRAAARVGRAHVGSAVNTIVLAYAGASLPLLLLIAASDEPVSELLTSEFITQEILRSAVGTIGLVASVPITTALATLVAELRPAAATGGHHRR